MGPSFPPLPPELVEFAHGGRSVLLGTCSNALEPECVRGVGVRVWSCACKLTVLIPAATGAITIANLRENGRLALTLSHIPSHKTIQVKGRVLAIRDGDDADREHAMRYRDEFAEALATVGLFPAVTKRLSVWPCHSVDVEIDVVYAQTPGPIAGEKMPLPEGRSL